MFPVQSYDQQVYLTMKFESFLEEFTPLFYTIVLKDEYRNAISEIRVEGHTAIQTPDKEFENDYYQKMLVLSQKRSNKVLEYMMNHNYYSTLNDSQRSFLRFISTSNGLAFGKALDSDGYLKFFSEKQIDTKKSMRVEFRIITNNQKVIDDWLLKTRKL